MCIPVLLPLSGSPVHVLSITVHTSPTRTAHIETGFRFQRTLWKPGAQQAHEILTKILLKMKMCMSPCCRPPPPPKSDSEVIIYANDLSKFLLLNFFLEQAGAVLVLDQVLSLYISARYLDQAAKFISVSVTSKNVISSSMVLEQETVVQQHHLQTYCVTAFKYSFLCSW